jgi:uncharacterized protein (TIGR03546 family)
MLSALVAPLRRIAHGLLAFNSAGQVASGFAIGMVVGLVPKGNLIALSLCVVLFCLRCNKGSGILAAMIFSAIAPWTDPFTHKIGAWVLTYPPLQATYASLFSMPFGAWLAFNNTIVIGSLLAGLYLAYPVYWMAYLCSLAIRRLFVGPPNGQLSVSQTGGLL